MPQTDSPRLLINATVASMGTGTTLASANSATTGDDLGLIEDGAVLIEDGSIAFVGTTAEALAHTAHRELATQSCGQRLLTPGLIDCHTHLVYGGDRSAEFEQRLEGASYEEIARAGGGIASTVFATRAASSEELLSSALTRLDALLADGVTTVEIKSGYGLDEVTEIRCLTVAGELAKRRPVEILPTYLGAHSVPPEAREGGQAARTAYLDLIINRVLPAVAKRGLATAVDGFCEGIAFSPKEIARVFERARSLGLPVKLHAEQLSNLGGARMAASFGALSVDHLEYLDEEGVDAIAAAGTVAVLLPGAFYYLRETQRPPVELLRRQEVPIAIATDLNPGSSPVHSLLATMNMACVLFELTPTEVLRGVTTNAARALGLADRGRIAPGLRADLALWNVDRPVGLCYPLGHHPSRAVWLGGQQVRGSVDRASDETDRGRPGMKR